MNTVHHKFFRIFFIKLNKNEIKSNKMKQNFGKMKFSKINFLLIKLIYMWIKGLALLINAGT